MSLSETPHQNIPLPGKHPPGQMKVTNRLKSHRCLNCPDCKS